MGMVESALGGALSGVAAGAPGGIPGMVAGGVAGLVIGGLSGASAEKDEKKRAALLNKSMEQFNILPPEQQKLVLDKLDLDGILTPTFMQEIKISDTEMANVKTDPRLAQAQMGALAQLQALGKSGGLDEADRANIEQARQRYAGEAASQQAGATEAAARRGISGSGMEMAQRAMAGQMAANQMNTMEQQTQGEARRRALEAIMKGGQLGGDIRTQEFSEQEKIAQAKDAINKLRSDNAMIAEKDRLAELRGIRDVKIGQAETNLGITNKEKITDWNAPRQNFEDKLAIATKSQPAYDSLSKYLGERSQDSKDMGADFITGGGKAYSGYLDYKKNQPKTP